MDARDGAIGAGWDAVDRVIVPSNLLLEMQRGLPMVYPPDFPRALIVICNRKSSFLIVCFSGLSLALSLKHVELPPVMEQEKSGAEADNALLVKQALHLLEDAIDGVELPKGSNGATKAGDFVYALFGHAGIKFDNVQVVP